MSMARRLEHPFQIGDLFFEFFKAASPLRWHLSVPLGCDRFEILRADPQQLEISAPVVARQSAAPAKEPVESARR